MNLNEFEKRLSLTRETMKSQNIDILMLDKSEDVYSKGIETLTGFSGSTAEIIISQDESFFLTDGRYLDNVKSLCKSTEIKVLSIHDFMQKKDKFGKKISPYKAFLQKIFGKKLLKKPCICIGGKILDNQALKKKIEFLKDIMTPIPSIIENPDFLIPIQKKYSTSENYQLSHNPIEEIIAQNPRKEPESLKILRKKILKNVRKKMKEENIEILVISKNKDVLSSRYAYLFGLDIPDGFICITSSETHFFNSEEISDFFENFKVKSHNPLIMIEGKILRSEKKYLDNLMPHNFKVTRDTDFLMQLQEIKYSEEIEIMREAQHHVDEILLKKFPKMLKEGITEKELAEKLEKALKSNGNYGLSFQAIVAFGENSASPHSTPSDRKLASNENILIDCGVTNHGYCSDLTRNFWFGEKENIQPEYLEDYEKLKNLQAEFTSHYYKKGISLKTIALKTSLRLKDLFEEDGVRHSLGHSLGIIEVHQSPSVSISNDSSIKFKKGHIQTNEPGVYRNGLYGIRIEDCIAISSNGADILTQLPHNLMLVNKNGELYLV